jgi:cytochrome c-type biogenesis protein CcmH/NrfG
LRSYLALHPAARTQWEDELSLNELLGKLGDAPVSSNFTSRILQRVEREAPAVARPQNGFGWFKSRWPRIAVVSALACAAVFSLSQYRAVKRNEIAHDIVAMSQAATVPQEWLQDFDAINRLSRPPVDDELLAALQ